MKTKLLLLSFSVILMFSYSYAQNQLWGVMQGAMAVAKGAENGAIFKTDSIGENLTLDYIFSSKGAMFPEHTKLCEANNGKLYGVSTSGGSTGEGVIFEFDPITEKYNIKFEFNSIIGSNPKGSMIKAPNGLLYGLTAYGGINGTGVLFVYDPLNNVYTKKFDFGGNYGGSPNGSLTLANNGKLYGMTNNGGNSNVGVIFEFNIQTGIYTKKVDFNSFNGAYPEGSLTLASDGKLYGLTSNGGSLGFGNLFEYTPGAESIVNLISFDNAGMGGYPKGGLLLTSTNALYGITNSGGSDSAGVIFEFDNALDTVYTRFNLDSAIHGYGSYSDLMEDASSQRIFGMTPYGGMYSNGTLFEFLPGTTSCVVKENFNNANGRGVNPLGTLMQASNQKIYGLTYNGGASGSGGVLFEYDVTNDTVIIKADLNVSSGYLPKSSLIQALNGKFYGTTYLGGLYDHGVIYEYDPSTHKYSNLHNFNKNTDGAYPTAELFEASNGKLYGTTNEGGADAGGILFEFNITNNSLSILHHFDTATGIFPMSGLIQIADTLYGMTQYGGTFGMGTIYKIDIAGTQYAVKLNFDGSNYGSYPNNGKLLIASNGKLYGTTSIGGLNSYGTLFEYDLALNSCIVKVPFDINMSSPSGSLIQSSNDTLYGLTSGGGQGYGTLFSYNLDTETASVKVQFDWVNIGAEPRGDLLEASNGMLYGLNSIGGINGNGVLFEYDILNDTLIATSALTSITGPPGGSLIETGCYTQYDTVKASICKGEIYSFGTQSLSTNGTYNETFQSVTGCDSIVTLYLIVACPSKTEYWGTTMAGGSNGVGAIFKVDEKGENETLVYSFTTGTNGNSPYGGLVQAENGKLYGMTSAGGINGMGVIYEFDPAKKIYTKKFDFVGPNGNSPKGDLVKAPNGLLYGLTEFGGINNVGVIFSYNPNTNSYIKRGDFDSIPSGASPVGSLLLVNDSLFYGVAKYGGVNGVGTIFKYNFTNESFIKTLDFNQYSYGSQPLGSLMQANNGLLYGVTSKGGINGFGMLFEYNMVTYQCSLRHEFYDFINGAYPQGKLVQATNGKLYGVAESGGFNNSGTLFEYDFYSNMFYTKVNFDSTLNGNKPHSSLTLSKTGNLLGMTSKGGALDKGVLFEFNFAHDSVTAKHSFNNTDGANPIYSSLLLVEKYPIYDSVAEFICEGDTFYLDTLQLTTTGNYTHLYITPGGLDSTVTINLTVNPIIELSINDTICQGDTLNFGSMLLTTANTYVDTLSSLVTGCDSIVTLNLFVNPLLDSTLFVSICEGTTYAFRGDSLGLSGTYKDTIPSLLTGCDSIVTLNLMVNPIFNDTINETICMGDFFVFGGDSLNLAGTYKDTLLSMTGCDSIITLNLLVNPVYYDTINETICQGETYMLGTQSLTLPGTYVEVFPSQLTCDSTVTLFLNVDSLPKKPDVPVGPIIVDNSIGSSDYMIIPALYADTYTWSILPVEAGIILSTETSATVTWSSSFTGVASIKVKGINFCGEGVSSDSLTVTVISNPLAQFTYIIDSLKVSFTNQSSNAGLYNWSFGDGNFSQIENPVYTYKTAGYYSVCLNVFNLATNQTSDTCMEIQVGNPLEACNAQFSITVQGDSVLLENTSSGEFTEVFWDFGDGSYSDSLNNVWHTYTKPNYYEIILTVFNSETGCIDKEKKIAKVIFDDAVLCDAQFSYFIDVDNVSFTGLSEGDITDYFWDFGDGTYSFEESPLHVFTEQGYFEVTLTTYSSITNCIDEISKVVFIYNPLVASCNASFTFYPKGNTVSFTSEATGAYSQHFWDFGNGFNSNTENPVHTFAKAGYYEVVYTVIDTTNGCFDSRSQLIFVEGATGGGNTKAEISAKYSYVPNKDTYEIKFKDESKGDITSWYWNFGDNTPASTVQHPVYVYDTNDYYRVCLTAGNSINQKTKCKFIAVGDVKNSSTAYFTYFADTATATGHFKDKSLGNIASWYWDFGDGNTSTQKNPSHTYIDKGYYAVCLTTTSASGVQKTYCNDVRIDNSIDNPCLFSCVWPGDANNDLEANHYDIMTIGLNYGMQGPKRDSASIGWYGQFAQNWSTYQLDGTNNKYGDANGDGAINLDDIEAIKQNFAFSHYRQPDTKSAEWSITCVWDKENSKRAGSRSSAKASLSPPQKGKASGIYAIGYEIAVIGGEKIKWDSVTVNFAKSWIGVDGESMLTVTSMDTNQYIIFIGMTRIDQQNITGSGEIATISFKFKDDVEETGVSFVVTSKGGIESSGEPTSVDGTIELVLKSPVAICEGETGVIDAGIGFASYTWSNGISDNSLIEVSEAGLYSVTVTDESGATAFATVEVVLNELPVVDLGTDISQDGSVELDAGSGFASYLWSTNAETQSITVTESGEYSVQVSNEFGCVGGDTINITITDIKLELTNQIAVYPNPNNGKFWLVYDFSKTSTHSVEIINVEGKTVWHTEFVEPDTKSNRIETDNLEQGVYYLKIVEDSNVGMVRFVVM